MTGFGRDIRDAWRGLLHQRGFTIAALVMLSLGIAAASAIFAAVEAVVLEMPFDEPDRIVAVFARGADDRPIGISRPQFESWRQATDIFEAVAAYTLVSPVMTGQEAATRLQAEAVTPSMFVVLGVQPRLGRTFRDDDGPVVVLSDGFWRSRFASDPAVLGRSVVLDGVSTTIVGVMPPGFDGPRSRPGDAWLPFSSVRADNPARPPSLSVVARLQVGVTPTAARARLEALVGNSAAAPGWTARVESMGENFLYQDALSRINLLVGGGALVLLMACVNVASLLLGRNMSRQRELALRLAIGANRGHIMRHVMIETLMLAGGATILGIVFASWMVSAMVPMVPQWFPRIAQIDIDWGVTAFAALTATASALIVSVWPGWAASRQDLGTLMKSGPGGAGRGGHRGRTTLVVVEATLGMVVLSAAAMFVGSFHRLNPTRPGFEFADRTKFSVRLGGPRYQDRAMRTAAVDEIAASLRALPGVAEVSEVTHVPLSGTSTVFPVRVHRQEPGTRRPPTVHFRAASPNYLPSIGMSIVKGRGLTAADDSGSQPVAVVNETLAARMLQGQDPLESAIVVEEPDGAVVRRIVGVVRDVRGAGSDLRAMAEVFVPYAQAPLELATFVVRSEGATSQVQQGIRRVMSAFDPALPVDRVETLGAVVERSVATQRFFATLMTGFAVVAVALAFVGLYSVAAWSVTQRTRELGVRIALGATPSTIRQLVLRHGVLVGLTGAVVGGAAAFASSRFIESFLFGFEPRQPALFVVLGLSFASIVTCASYLPARRAMRVDPIVVLRTD